MTEHFDRTQVTETVKQPLRCRCCVMEGHKDGNCGHGEVSRSGTKAEMLPNVSCCSVAASADQARLANAGPLCWKHRVPLQPVCCHIEPPKDYERTMRLDFQ